MVARSIVRGVKLDELARRAGTSPRTVRYYVQRGLLAPPAFRGKDTAYDEAHLLRLRAIRTLQEAFLPLDAIAAALDGKSDATLARWADGHDLPLSRPIAPAAPSIGASDAPAAPDVAPTGVVLRRYRLAEGVDLTVAEDCPPASRRLVESILGRSSGTPT
jgi:Ca-activated chloride channel family protein